MPSSMECWRPGVETAFLGISTFPRRLENSTRFLAFFGRYDVIIGTRKNQAGKIIQRQPWRREPLGKGFTLLSRLMLDVRVTDFTCGFKCFSRGAAEAIFLRLTIDRWGFEAEILFLVKRFGFTLAEVSVRGQNDLETRGNLKRDVWRSFSDLFQIRVNSLCRFY